MAANLKDIVQSYHAATEVIGGQKGIVCSEMILYEMPIRFIVLERHLH
jgi:hypothetical protein